MTQWRHLLSQVSKPSSPGSFNKAALVIKLQDIRARNASPSCGTRGTRGTLPIEETFSPSTTFPWVPHTLFGKEEPCSVKKTREHLNKLSASVNPSIKPSIGIHHKRHITIFPCFPHPYSSHSSPLTYEWMFKINQHPISAPRFRPHLHLSPQTRRLRKIRSSLNWLICDI